MELFLGGAGILPALGQVKVQRIFSSVIETRKDQKLYQLPLQFKPKSAIEMNLIKIRVSVKVNIY